MTKVKGPAIGGTTVATLRRHSLATILEVANADGLATLHPLSRHQVGVLLSLDLTRRAWEVVHTDIAFDSIVLFKASVGGLHQSLRVNLPVVELFSSLQLRSHLHLLLLLACVAADLVQANSPVIPHRVGDLDRAAARLLISNLLLRTSGRVEVSVREVFHPKNFLGVVALAVDRVLVAGVVVEGVD